MDSRLPRNEDYTIGARKRNPHDDFWQIAHVDASTTDVPVGIVGHILWRDGIWTKIAHADGRVEIQSETGSVRYLDANGQVKDYEGHPYPMVPLSPLEAEALQKTNRDGRRQFAYATEQSRKVAARRYPVLRDALLSNPQAAAKRHNIGLSTLYRWVADYQAAANAYGAGYVGLLPQPFRGLNNQPHISQATELMIDRYLKPTLRLTYKHYLAGCKDEGVEPVSYATFCRRARRMR